MKKALTLAAIAVFCSVVALAGQHVGATGVAGTISKVDMAGKSMVVKTADGKETTIYWNDATKLQGTVKEGEMVHVKTTDKDGKAWATWVKVGKTEPKP